LRTVHKAKDDISVTGDSNVNSLYRFDIEKRSLKKVLTYIFVFIVQYIPIVVFYAFGFAKVNFFLKKKKKTKKKNNNNVVTSEMYFYLLDSTCYTFRTQSCR
jgi:hypothetical protein